MEELLTKRDAVIALEEYDRLKSTVSEKKYQARNAKGDVLYEHNLDDVILRNVGAFYDNVHDFFKDTADFTPVHVGDMMLGGRFIPAGSILSRFGLEKLKERIPEVYVPNQSMSNCYFTPIEEDSLSGINQCMNNMEQTYSRRGGSGTDITILRPNGAPVANAARTSSGAPSVMGKLSESTYYVGTHGRRAALIITMSVMHPDIVQFIHSKSDSEKAFGRDQLTGHLVDVTGANISIKLTDKFMQAVENDEDWDLVFPDFDNDREYYDKHWKGDYDSYQGKMRVYATVKARDIFKEFYESAWASGDPGAAFFDRVIEMTPSASLGDEYTPVGFNPCFHGDTLIGTSEGPKKIKDLVEKEVTIFDGKEWVKNNSFRLTAQEQPLLRVMFDDGVSVRVTPYHTFYKSDGTRLEAKDLKLNDTVEFAAVPSYGTREEAGAFFKGFVVGINTIPRKTRTNDFYLTWEKQKYSLDIVNSLKEIDPDQMYSLDKHGPHGRRKYIDGVLTDKYFPKEFMDSRESGLPSFVFEYNKQTKIEFFQGIFAASAVKSGTFSRASRTFSARFSSLELGQSIVHLLQTVGIYAKVVKSITEKKKVVRGSRVIIDPRNASKFSNMMNVKHLNKIILPYFDEKPMYRKIIGIYDECGAHDVYCCTVPTTHKVMLSNGVVTGQCAEQPLPPWMNCLLGAVVLHKYVSNPYTRDAKFDLETFKDDVRHAVLFLNVVSKVNTPLHPLPQQREADEKSRRIGIEFTGLGDCLAMLGYKYGSKEAITFLEFLLSNKAYTEIEASIDIAEVNGPCPALKDEASRVKFANSKYMQSINLPAHVRGSLIEFGCANIAFNTVGPTGTISIMADNCTSGVEPLFAFSYWRESRLAEGLFQCTHTTAIRHILATEKEHNWNLTPSQWRDSLNYVQANDIHYQDRIATQAVVQKYTDSSVSSTVNLPNTATPEEIGQIYMEAWKAGLKGITIFRDGCKKGVLTVTKDDQSPLVGPIIPPDVAMASRFKVHWKGKKMYVTVSVDDTGAPFEIFVTLPRKAGYDKDGNYSEVRYHEMFSLWETVTRLASMLLRYRIPLYEVVRQLDNSTHTISDAAAVLAHVLKNFLHVPDASDDEIVAKGLGYPCPHCGDNAYVYENGCGSCRSCGGSTCG